MSDISAIITAHREGAMAGVALASLLAAVQRARGEGLDVEVIAMLDNPDAATSAVFDDAAVHGWTLEIVSFADQGLVRNRAIELAKGRYVAFLDADDLWSENWLTAAYELCETEPGRIIGHPDVNWFFESNNNLFFHADQTDPSFELNMLRFSNYWDALCMAPRAAYVENPFSVRAVAEGFAYEDWHWNCETVLEGYVHRVAPDTIHFKRRRQASQNITASTSRCLTRPSRLFTYDWAASSQ